MQEESHSPTSTITLQVNGVERRLEVEHRWTLLHVLREVLDLTGSKVGCDRAECGACTVLLGDLPIYACQMLAVQAAGRPILTVEGLARDGALDPVQQAFLDEDGGQCGYCSPGFLMTTKALLDANPDPTEQDIKFALAGNLCRCNAYGRIIAAVKTAASLRKPS